MEEDDGEIDINEARRQGSYRSSESRISAAQSSLSSAQLKAKVAENELEALRQVLKGKEAWVKAAKENVALHEENMSQARGGERRKKRRGKERRREWVNR